MKNQPSFTSVDKWIASYTVISVHFIFVTGMSVEAILSMTLQFNTSNASPVSELVSEWVTD